MSKSESAFAYWQRSQRIKSAEDKFIKNIKLGRVGRFKKHIINYAKYLFYAALFKIAIGEFYLNLYIGKFLIACFNLVNRHKLRVNFVVNYYAEKCRETTK